MRRFAVALSLSWSVFASAQQPAPAAPPRSEVRLIGRIVTLDGTPVAGAALAAGGKDEIAILDYNAINAHGTLIELARNFGIAGGQFRHNEQ